MSKFKIRFKLQGLEVDVEGSKEDLPYLSQALGNQLIGTLGPALELVNGPVVASAPPAAEPIAASNGRKPRRRKVASATGGSTTPVASAEIDWRHDPQKWGAPHQTWVTLDKCIWLIYVVEKEKGLTELTQPQISATFNKHFKQAGLIKASNVSRDLGKKKSGKEALVGENTQTSPSAWFLTDSGRKHAENLISQQSQS